MSDDYAHDFLIDHLTGELSAIRTEKALLKEALLLICEVSKGKPRAIAESMLAQLRLKQVPTPMSEPRS